MRSRTIAKPIGTDAETHFHAAQHERVQNELQFSESTTIRWDRTTRGIRAHVKVRLPAPATPTEAEPHPWKIEQVSDTIFTVTDGWIALAELPNTNWWYSSGAPYYETIDRVYEPGNVEGHIIIPRGEERLIWITAISNNYPEPTTTSGPGEPTTPGAHVVASTDKPPHWEQDGPLPFDPYVYYIHNRSYCRIGYVINPDTGPAVITQELRDNPTLYFPPGNMISYPGTGFGLSGGGVGSSATWSSSKNYRTGSIVHYSGKLYVRSRLTSGNGGTPNSGGSDWDYLVG